MNQNQRKYALERIDEIVRNKTKAWEEANPKPTNPSSSNKKDTVIGGGYYTSSNPGLQTILQEVQDMKAVVDGGLIAIDVDAANMALERILRDVEGATTSYGRHISVFDLTNFVKIPENIRTARAEELVRRRGEVTQWEERRRAFLQPITDEANSLKDRVMLGNGAEALIALEQINTFAGEATAAAGD